MRSGANESPTNYGKKRKFQNGNGGSKISLWPHHNFFVFFPLRIFPLRSFCVCVFLAASSSLYSWQQYLQFLKFSSLLSVPFRSFPCHFFLFYGPAAKRSSSKNFNITREAKNTEAKTKKKEKVLWNMHMLIWAYSVPRLHINKHAQPSTFLFSLHNFIKARTNRSYPLRCSRWECWRECAPD